MERIAEGEWEREEVRAGGGVEGQRESECMEKGARYRLNSCLYPKATSTSSS